MIFNTPAYQVAAPVGQPTSNQLVIVDNNIQPMRSVADRPPTPPVMAPCLQRFVKDGFLYPPNVKTQKGLVEARAIADEWANYINIPIELVHAWKSLGIDKDESNLHEQRLYRREAIIRKQCYSIWRSSGRNFRKLDEIMHNLMERNNIKKYKPMKQEKSSQQKQVSLRF